MVVVQMNGEKKVALEGSVHRNVRLGALLAQGGFPMLIQMTVQCGDAKANFGKKSPV